MTRPLNVPRKLRQLDNDVQSIYEMLTGIAGTQVRHGNRLDELATQLDRMDAQLLLHDQKLSAHGEMLASHGETLAAHGERFDRIDLKLDTIIGLLEHR